MKIIGKLVSFDSVDNESYNIVVDAICSRKISKNGLMQIKLVISKEDATKLHLGQLIEVEIEAEIETGEKK